MAKESQNNLETVKKRFISKTDFQILREFMIEKNITCITFREAGEDTIKKLEAGSGAKPHSILDKTIRKNDFESGEGSAKYSGIPGIDILFGLVAKRNRASVDQIRGEIIGIYLTRYGAEVFEKDPALHDKIVKESDEISYLSVKDVIPYIIELLNNSSINYYPCFFTGDYDIHDLMQANKIVVTKLDMGILSAFQMKSRKQWKNIFLPSNENFQGIMKEKYLSDYQRIQHGPQYNYIAQMENENMITNFRAAELDKVTLEELKKMIKKFNVLVKQVAEPSFDIVEVTISDNREKMLDCTIIDNISDLKAMYKKYGMVIKNVWGEDGEAAMNSFFENSKKNTDMFVALVRKCKVYSLYKDDIEKLLNDCKLT